MVRGDGDLGKGLRGGMERPAEAATAGMDERMRGNDEEAER